MSAFHLEIFLKCLYASIKYNLYINAIRNRLNYINVEFISKNNTKSQTKYKFNIYYVKICFIPT